MTSGAARMTRVVTLSAVAVCWRDPALRGQTQPEARARSRRSAMTRRPDQGSRRARVRQARRRLRKEKVARSAEVVRPPS